jgi:hypothetical protein
MSVEVTVEECGPVVGVDLNHHHMPAMPQVSHEDEVLAFLA